MMKWRAKTGSVRSALVQVLTWNLMHGRALPPARRDLLDEFTAAIGKWEWDVALLQEVPPSWPRELGGRLRGDHRQVLTSRNWLLPVRRSMAVRWPDLIKSNGGGCNAILVRGGIASEHRTRRLCRLPERRWMHAVRIERFNVWVGNLHATVRNGAAARREAQDAAATLLRWSGDDPAILGGDFNVRRLTLEGFQWAGGHDVDHLFVHRAGPEGDTEVLERGRLSDHAPVRVQIRPG